MKALNVFLFSNTKEHMLLTVGIECSFEIQSITRKYGHGYGNEQKKESFSCHLLLSTVCRSFAGVTRSMMDTDNWTPSPKRRLNFILSQNNECSHLLRAHVCVVLDSFSRVAFFFSLFSYISRGGTQQSLGGGSPPKSYALSFYIPFLTWYQAWDAVFHQQMKREEKRREKKSWKYDAQRSIHFYWETLPLSHT